MKKIVSTFFVCLLLVGCVFAFTACGATISGEYKAAFSVTTYKFSFNKVTITVDNIIGEDTVIEGKYSIEKDEEDNRTITFTFESTEKDADDYSGTFTFKEGEEEGKKYIQIGPIKYYKQ